MIYSTNLSEHKWSVVFQKDLTVADGGKRSRPTAEGALAGLLRRRVDSLPASVAWRQVWTSHPAVVPHVEVPSGKGQVLIRQRVHVGSRQHRNDEDRTYQMESALRCSIGSRFSSRYTSVVKETSVSWAELKLVTVRPGMPKHRKTDKKIDWYGASGQYLRNVYLSQRHVGRIKSPTCRENTSKDPALAVLDRGALVFMVLLQDFHTPAPNCWTGSIRVDSRPVSRHDAAIIYRVDLDKNRRRFSVAEKTETLTVCFHL